MELGGHGNVGQILSQLRSTLIAHGYTSQAATELWNFPTIATFSGQLEKAGFEVQYAHLVDRPTELTSTEAGIIDWLSMFCSSFFEGVPDDQAIIIKQEVQEALRDPLFKDGKWFADYRRLRVMASKTAS